MREVYPTPVNALSGVSFGDLAGTSWQWLDRYRGEYPWHQALNLVALRVLSFHLDLHWAQLSLKGELVWPTRSAKTPRAIEGHSFDYGMRVETPQPLEHYSLEASLAHALYVPLYIAGPILPFNAFASQMATPQKAVPSTAIVLYAVRLGFLFSLLEMGTRLAPAFALGRSGILSRLAPNDQAVLAFITLQLMWFKFTVIWRFAR